METNDGIGETVCPADPGCSEVEFQDSELSSSSRDVVRTTRS